MERDDQGRRYIVKGRKKFIERTKDFFIKEGKEDEHRDAIRIRERMGDELPIGNGLDTTNK